MADETHVNREQEAGVRGGAAAAAAYAPAGAYAPAAAGWLAFTDKVRWGPVWAGFLTFFSLWIWFTAIGFASWASASAGSPGAAFGPGFAVWTGVTGLVAIFIGGVIMSRLAGIAGYANGIWNGVVLWGLAFTLLMIMASLGAGGMLGSMFGGSSMMTPMRTGVGGGTLSTVSVSAWWFLIFQFVALLLAAAGGAVGARPAQEETEAH